MPFFATDHSILLMAHILILHTKKTVTFMDT